MSLANRGGEVKPIGLLRHRVTNKFLDVAIARMVPRPGDRRLAVASVKLRITSRVAALHARPSILAKLLRLC